MKKVGLILVLILLTSKISTVFAYDFSAVYNGQRLYFNILSDTIPYTVEVTSENKEYPFYDTCPIGNLSIPASVTDNGKTYKIVQIGYGAFYGCQDLTSVTIANTVTKIGEFAFTNDTSIAVLALPDSLKIIGYCAFQSCIALTSITLPISLECIDTAAFLYCIGLISIDIPENVKEIRMGAFSRCEKLISINVSNKNTYYTSFDGLLYTYSMDVLVACPGTKSGTLIVPETVKRIEGMACYFCKKITSIVFSSSLTRIEYGAFCYCSGLSGSLKLPESLKYIGYGAFYKCEGLTDSLIIPDSVKIIDRDAFYGCEGLETVHFGNSVEIIGIYAFYSCENIQGKIVFPNTLKWIGRGAFENCQKITSVIMGDSLNFIGEKAFLYCIHLNDITIGKSVDTIGMIAFYCDVKEVTIKAAFPPVTYYKIFNYSYPNIILYVPCGSKEYYESDTNWDGFSDIREGEMEYRINMQANNDLYGVASASAPDCIAYQSEIKAIANSGYEFEKWSDGDTNNPRKVIVTSDTAFTAIFKNKVGVEESDVNNTMNIYPNPATNQLTFDNGSSIMKEVMFYDVSGRELKRFAINTNKTVLDVNDLQRGMYIVKINNEQGVITRKVQVVR